jgi:hypothetical protein
MLANTDLAKSGTVEVYYPRITRKNAIQRAHPDQLCFKRQRGVIRIYRASFHEKRYSFCLCSPMERKREISVIKTRPE